MLDQLHAPLCDALLADTGSQERLQALEASNSFLIPLDRQREWYRYHPLFREFLLGELRRVEPEVVIKLHLAGGRLVRGERLAGDGTGAPAEHQRAGPLRAAGDPAGAADLQRRTDVDGQAVAGALGDASIAAYPPLMVLAGWIGVLGGEPLEAERWAALADDAVLRHGARRRHRIVRVLASHAARRDVSGRRGHR